MPENRRWLRRLLVGLVAVIVIIVAAVWAAPLVVPSEFMAGEIARLVRAETNRDLRIAGPISFSLLPRVTLVAHDVVLASPSGSFSQDFLTVKTVDLALKPLPLLHGAIEIERLALTQPTVHLEVDKNGERNWIFRRPLAIPSPAATKPVTPPSFPSGNATVVDGAATYFDQRTNLRRTIGGIALTVSLPSAAGPLDAAGSALVNGDTVTIAASLASPATLRGGGASRATLDLSAPHATLGFRGELGGATNTTGTVDFKTPSLGSFLEWADPRLGHQDFDLGALAVTGKLDLAESTATLSNATTSLNDVTAQGTLVLHHADGRLELDAADLAIAGGKASGKLVAEKTGPVPSLALTLALTGVTAHDLPVHIAGFDSLSGAGDAALDLSGSGKTMRDIVRSLNGSARIAFANGAVAATGLEPLLRNALGPAVLGKSVPKEIAYRTLSASATIDNGILRNDDLRLAGPALSASGSGTLDLTQKTLDYLWQPNITGLGSARIAITGSWNTPNYKLQSLNIEKTKGITIPGLKLR